MSTEHMPKPPDTSTKQASDTSAETQAAATVEQEAVPATPLSLNEDMARIIQEQVDIIVQKQLYHCQLLFGVSGIGADSVNVRNTTLAFANALRNNHPDQMVLTLANLGDPQISQINDQTTPFKFNAQVAGLLEGILIDTISRAYGDDAGRQREGRMMLEKLFVEANEQMEKQSKSMLLFQAPGPHPNARV